MAKKNSEYQLAIRIKGNVDSTFTSSLTKSKTKLQEFHDNVNKWTQQADEAYGGLAKGFKKMAKFAATAATALGTATVIAAKKVYDAGSEFEQAFTLVKKTVGDTDFDFSILENQILDLAEALPVTATEIATVAEAAAHLGIPAENLMDFTTVMMQFAATTDMEAAEAAEQLAKFMNIMKTDYGDVDKLGSSIMELGNSYATTEAEIIAMSMRLAATGKQVGLSEAEVTALSTAMSSMGIAAQNGGTAMSKLLKKMATAAETGKGLDEFAQVAGLSDQAFKDMFQTNSYGVLEKFISGLNDTTRNGKTALAVINDMGLNEVRLSNVILALAGDSDVLNRVLKTSNEAWDENVALQERTAIVTESTVAKVDMVGNAAQNAAIKVYDAVKGEIANASDDLIKIIHNIGEYLGGRNGVSAWVQNIKDSLPTAINALKSAKTAIEPFANALLTVGKWCVKNPKALANVFSALLSVLISYKGVTTILKIASAVTALPTPITLVIAGLGLLTTGIIHARQRAEELKNINLDEHFGDVALSLEDIDYLARKIVDSDGSFTKLQTVMESVNKATDYAATIVDSLREVEKLNMKVKIGVKLTDNDQNAYKQAVEDYITACNDYIAENHYVVSMGAEIFGLSSDSFTTSKMQEYYSGISSQMSQLGEILAEGVNSAFSDNVLTIDEADVIARTQQYMANIQKGIADSQFSAQLALIKAQGGFDDLTPESFEATLQKASEAVAQMQETYDKAYLWTAAYNASAYGEGTAAYKQAMAELDKNYAGVKAEANNRVLSWAADEILNRYGSEYGAFFTTPTTGRTSEFGWGDYYSVFLERARENRQNGTQGAVGEIMKILEPTVEEQNALLERYRQLGGDIVGSTLEGTLDTVKKLGILGGNDFGEYVTEMLAPKTYYDDRGYPVSYSAHASGGIFSQPHLGLVAEAGPESIIPLNRSENARSLLRRTAALMGMSGVGDIGSSASPSIVYQPTLVFNGEAPSRADLDGAMAMSQEKFEMMMDRYLRNRSRVAF